MNPSIPPTPTSREEVYRLASAVLSQEISEADARRLEDLVVHDAAACAWYVEFMCDAYNLHANARVGRRSSPRPPRTALAIGGEEEASAPPQTALPPLGDIPASGVRAPVHSWPSRWLMAYGLATMVIAAVTFGMGVMIGSVTDPSRPAQVAQRLPGATDCQAMPEHEAASVGRITDLMDCQWADASTKANRGDFVPLGRKYELVSGLIEISYDIGAKVILEGPVTYAIESRNGGFLATGKLTVKATTEEAKGFAVRTPTAVVTDLGTEFGVGVDKQGATTSRVFRGLARLNVLADSGEPDGAGQLLHENESARVDRRNQRPTMASPDSKAVTFVRELPKSILTTFDLVDVLAGGDGFSGRRNAGIDPTSGRRSTEAFIRNIQIDDSVLRVNPGVGGGITDKWAIGDGKLHPVEELKFVDGVFIPDGSKGPITVDSMGHRFADCPTTLNYAPFLVWAGGAIPQAQFPVTTTVNGVDYARNGHALLHLHANLGITFNLDAVRKATPGWTVRRFSAIVANMELRSEAGTNVTADYWVLVDGRVRSYRSQINARDGALPISVAINSQDRFLTLVSTDGGNGIDCDLITFIDPQLELFEEDHRPATPKGLSMTAKPGSNAHDVDLHTAK